MSGAILLWLQRFEQKTAQTDIFCNLCCSFAPTRRILISRAYPSSTENCLHVQNRYPSPLKRSAFAGRPLSSFPNIAKTAKGQLHAAEIIQVQRWVVEICTMTTDFCRGQKNKNGRTTSCGKQFPSYLRHWRLPDVLNASCSVAQSVLQSVQAVQLSLTVTRSRARSSAARVRSSWIRFKSGGSHSRPVQVTAASFCNLSSVVLKALDQGASLADRLCWLDAYFVPVAVRQPASDRKV